MEDVGHLGGAEVARRLNPGAGLALCHRFVPFSSPNPDRRAEQKDVRRRTGLSVTLLGAVRTGRLLGLARPPTIARLGGFSSKIPRRVCSLGKVESTPYVAMMAGKARLEPVDRQAQALVQAGPGLPAQGLAGGGRVQGRAARVAGAARGPLGLAGPADPG